MARFYVYVHKDLRGRVFYVGKGTGRRAWSRDRHQVWHRYVAERLGGQFEVEIVKDGLTEPQALELEEQIMSDHGDQLVNWANLGRPVDVGALDLYWAKRNQSKRLLDLAKDIEKSDPAAAARHCLEALALVHEYSSIQTETGLVGELVERRRVGDPHVIFRLAQCRKRLGDLATLESEIDEYMSRYPDAREHSVGKAVLKIRAGRPSRGPDSS